MAVVHRLRATRAILGSRRINARRPLRTRRLSLWCAPRGLKWARAATAANTIAAAVSAVAAAVRLRSDCGLHRRCGGLCRALACAAAMGATWCTSASAGRLVHGGAATRRFCIMTLLLLSWRESWCRHSALGICRSCGRAWCR